MSQLAGENLPLKEKITNIVKEYTRLFPEEYTAFKNAMREKRYKAFHRTGKIEGADVLDRPIHEIPETMYGIINLHLSEDELKEFQGTIMSRWFAKTFKDFSIVEKV